MLILEIDVDSSILIWNLYSAITLSQTQNNSLRVTVQNRPKRTHLRRFHLETLRNLRVQFLHIRKARNERHRTAVRQLAMELEGALRHGRHGDAIIRFMHVALVLRLVVVGYRWCGRRDGLMTVLLEHFRCYHTRKTLINWSEVARKLEQNDKYNYQGR